MNHASNPNRIEPNADTHDALGANLKTLWRRWRSMCLAHFNENPIEYILHPVSSRISSFSLLMMLGNPFYYWVWAHVLVQPYENFAARLTVTLLGAVLLLPKINRHPTSLLTGLVFVGVVWVQLPVFFIWMYLCNAGAPVWMATVVGMILIWYHVTDWRIATLGLALGTWVAWGLYSLTDVSALPAWSEQDMATHAVVIGFGLFFAIMLGAFSANVKRIQMKLVQARARQSALQSLAGSIAHEMRNPLGQVKHAMVMSAELLPAEQSAHACVLGPQQLRDLHQHLQQGQVAIRRGLQVIDMTLDQVNFRPMDASHFVRLSAADTVQKALHEYHFESADERARVHVVCVQDFDFMGHETSLMFVLFNLMRNALYYFHQHPQATLTITLEAHCIRVKDTGPGIAKPVQERLFEAFETSGKVGGTGLGLAYCQRVMQAFGGRIACHSVLDEYTEFSLFFVPLTAAHRLDDSSVHAPDATMADRTGLTATASPLLIGKTLLVIDDMAINRTMVCAYAQRWGMQVLQAQHGQETLRMLAEPGIHVDALVLDMHMPGMDGLEVARRLRRIGRFQHVPIVALTGRSDAHTREVALAAGMDDFITKPLDGAVLHQTLCRLLLQAQPVHEAAESQPTRHELSLLDLNHLHELQRNLPELLPQLWPAYVDNFDQLQTRMHAALERRDLQELMIATHGLVGNSGNVGARAVHSFLKFQVMPDIERGLWPQDDDWLDILRDLRLRTDAQMSHYLAQQTVACAHM